MYKRRSDFNPLWNSHLVAGPDFLGYVDLLGTTYQADSIATGYGAYIAQPLLRKALESGNLKEQDARKLLEDCMRVLFYRDARSLNKIQIAKVDASGLTISEPFSLDTEWSFAENIRGY